MYLNNGLAIRLAIAKCINLQGQTLKLTHRNHSSLAAERREPRKALGVDIGEGAVVRYIEATGEVVGLTLIGVKERLLKSLKSN